MTQTQDLAVVGAIGYLVTGMTSALLQPKGSNGVGITIAAVSAVPLLLKTPDEWRRKLGFAGFVIGTGIASGKIFSLDGPKQILTAAGIATGSLLAVNYLKSSIGSLLNREELMIIPSFLVGLGVGMKSTKVSAWALLAANLQLAATSTGDYYIDNVNTFLNFACILMTSSTLITSYKILA